MIYEPLGNVTIRFRQSFSDPENEKLSFVEMIASKVFQRKDGKEQEFAVSQAYHLNRPIGEAVKDFLITTKEKFEEAEKEVNNA